MSRFHEGKQAVAPDTSDPQHVAGFYAGQAERAQQAASARQAAAGAYGYPSSGGGGEGLGLILLLVAAFLYFVFVCAMVALAWLAVLCGPVLLGALLLRRGETGYLRACAATAGAAAVLVIGVIALVSSGWPYAGPPKAVLVVSVLLTLAASSLLLRRGVAGRSGPVRCIIVSSFVATSGVIGTYVANQSSLSHQVVASLAGREIAADVTSLAEEKSLYEWLDWSSLLTPEPMRRDDYLAALPTSDQIASEVQGANPVEAAAYREVVAYELKHILLSIAPGSTFHKQLSEHEQALVLDYILGAERFKREKLAARSSGDSRIFISGFLLGPKLAAVSIVRDRWPALARAYALHRRGYLR